MPAPDIVQLVRSAIKSKKEVPALLDAYGEFIDGPIGPLELQNLGEVLTQILDNLSQRFPEAASRRAAMTAQSDVTGFLTAANNDVDRLKEIMREELRSVSESMVTSIAERFRRMDNDERQAIDATLRIIRRSSVELLFKSGVGKPLTSTDIGFQRHFALVKSQAKGIRELRYVNLIVEKGIFNKLVLKSDIGDQWIWVPSLYAKENADELIARNSISSDQRLLSVLKGLTEDKLESSTPFLERLLDDLGVVAEGAHVPDELKSHFQKVGDLTVLPPIDLDDIFQYFETMKVEQQVALRVEEEKRKSEVEAQRLEQEMKLQEQRQRLRATTISAPKPEILATDKNSVYLGKDLDIGQLVQALTRRASEEDLPDLVKQMGDYSLLLGSDITIIGSSGSGKSVTLKRIIDGIAAKGNSRIVLIDFKGEHRGIAWKYKWQVHAFLSDSQADKLAVTLFSDSQEPDSSLAADLLQEWFLQGGISCSDQQRQRMASVISSCTEKRPTLDAISDLLTKEGELAQLGQKLRKNLVQRSSFPSIFSGKSSMADSLEMGSVIFDISGRGLRDATTKEEIQVISVLLIRDLLEKHITDSVIVIEDVLDRFKAESLKSRVVQMIQKLRSNGNKLIITSRGPAREFLQPHPVELLHRLSGEKVISESFSEFDTDVPKQSLAKVIGFLPRGYLFASKMKFPSGTKGTSAVKVEQLEFSGS